jgi:heme-degrading monooxygenase HmoA
MYARVTQFQMKPGRRDDAVRIADQEILPGMKEDQGFRHIYVLVDEQGTDGMVITLWETAADEQASRAKVGQRFGQLSDVLAGQPQPSQVYEVATER